MSEDDEQTEVKPWTSVEEVLKTAYAEERTKRKRLEDFVNSDLVEWGTREGRWAYTRHGSVFTDTGKYPTMADAVQAYLDSKEEGRGSTGGDFNG